MAVWKQSLLVAVLALNLRLISSSCLTEGDAHGKRHVTPKVLTDAIGKYTLKMYKNMVRDPQTKSKNIVTSPYSIWSALTLTYLGARGRSSAVLGNILSLHGLSKPKIEEQVKVLSSKLSSSDGNIFTVANRIAFDETLDIKSCLVDDSSVELKKASFSQSPENERVELNKWVESKTNNLIKNLLPYGSITPDTVLAILNAVYFKGKWLNNFNKRWTKEKTFFSVNGKSRVRMMHREGNMATGVDNKLGASYVDLPYVGDNYSMLAILPHKDNPNIDSVISKMSPQALQSIWDSLRVRKVSLGFPRFNLTESVNLKKVLSNIGGSSLFRNINLPGIVRTALPLKISDIFHKTFVKVDEEGTEAAGATAILIVTKSASQTTVLNFNRPFAFILREKHTNAILFMGVVRSL